MRGERGQGSVEWIAVVLVAALALGALARFAPQAAEPAELASALFDATACAAGRGCGADPRAGRADPAGAAPPGAAGRAVIAPPLVPLTPAPDAPRLRPVPRPRRGLLSTGRLGRGIRRGAGVFWRRAWLLCIGYERARYGLVHPESAPRRTVALSGALQIVNDCASPIDFSRDWEHLTP